MNSPYFYDDQGRLNFRLVAAPYNGPIEGKDFQGHYFHKSTDFGPIPMAVSYLDHNKLIVEHPELKSLQGIDDRLGVAYREMSADEGLVYRIVVDEAYRYQNMLKALADQGLLYASTTPYQKSVKLDKETGRIDRYEIIEVTATWKPANPEAELLFKSLVMEEIQKMEDNKTSTTETPAGEGQAPESVSEQPLTDMVEGAIAALDAANAEADEKSMPAWAAALVAKIDALTTEVGEVKKGYEKSMADVQTAMPKIVELAAKAMGKTIAVEGGKSTAQQIVEKSIAEQFQQGRDANGRNINRPGAERKANFAGKAS